MKSINDQYMNTRIKAFPAHVCKICGCERKLVETIVDDEFYWDKGSKMYQPNGFTDMFEHTGNNRCADCGKEWTGL
jgi:rRNA maturation endonuclease Nob1